MTELVRAVRRCSPEAMCSDWRGGVPLLEDKRADAATETPEA